MPLQKGQLVLIDTNVIIEAHDAGCLSQLAGFFCLCTVEQVIAETQRGSQRRNPARNIDESQLRKWMHQIATISDEERFEFTLAHQAVGLDEGERDLLAWAEKMEGAWVLNSPDMAVLRFAHKMGWLDRLVSLEAMCKCISARLKQDLKDNFREPWLSMSRLDLNMGVLR